MKNFFIPLIQLEEEGNILRKNPVSEVKNQIRFIKRQGGTLRFAKDLRAVRKQEEKKRIAQKVRFNSGIILFIFIAPLA